MGPSLCNSLALFPTVAVLSVLVALRRYPPCTGPHETEGFLAQIASRCHVLTRSPAVLMDCPRSPCCPLLQDCSVGIMFALMPAFGAAAASHSVAASAAAATASELHAAILSIALLMAQVLLKLLLLVLVASAVAKLMLPVLLRLLTK